jgi:hypothetical protein
MRKTIVAALAAATLLAIGACTPVDGSSARPARTPATTAPADPNALKGDQAPPSVTPLDCSKEQAKRAQVSTPNNQTIIIGDNGKGKPDYGVNVDSGQSGLKFYVRTCHFDADDSIVMFVTGQKDPNHLYLANYQDQDPGNFKGEIGSSLIHDNQSNDQAIKDVTVAPIGKAGDSAAVYHILFYRATKVGVRIMQSMIKQAKAGDKTGFTQLPEGLDSMGMGVLNVAVWFPKGE